MAVANSGARSGTWMSPGRPSWRMSVSAIALMVLIQLPIGNALWRGDGIGALLGREAVYWVWTVFLVVYVLRVERQPLSSVGLWPLSWRSLLYGFLGAAVMVGGMALIYIVVLPGLGLADNEGGLASIQALPGWFRMLLVIRAAVFEELYFRGFMIERLTAILGLRWVAAAISLAAFTLAHLQFWGWTHLIVAGFGGVVLTALYLFRKDLGTNMIAHFLTDAIGFLLG